MTVRKSPSGIYHVEFQCQGKRIHRSAKTTKRHEALAFESDLRGQLLRSTRASPRRPPITLEEACERYYVEHRVPNARKAKSLVDDRYMLINSRGGLSACVMWFVVGVAAELSMTTTPSINPSKLSRLMFRNPCYAGQPEVTASGPLLGCSRSLGSSPRHRSANDWGSAKIEKQWPFARDLVQ